MSCSPEGRADFVSSLVFEGQRHTGAKGGDFAVFDLHVHLRDFGHAEVPQRAGCRFHRRAARVLPRLLANPDDFDDLVDGVGLLLRHDSPPYSMRALDRAPSDVNSIVGPHPSRVTPPASAIATRAAPAFSLLESAQLLAEAIRSFTERCACGIKPNVKRIKQHLDDSLLPVTALNPRIGYKKAAQISLLAY